MAKRISQPCTVELWRYCLCQPPKLLLLLIMSRFIEGLLCPAHSSMGGAVMGSVVDDGADALAFVHQIEGLVDLLEGHGVGDEVVQPEFPCM